jgi:hypothetical protein
MIPPGPEISPDFRAFFVSVRTCQRGCVAIGANGYILGIGKNSPLAASRLASTNHHF